MRATNQTSTCVEQPDQYSNAWHMDIGFGPCTAIGRITHVLYLVDRKTRTLFVYLLKNATSSLLKQMKRFMSEVGVKPKTIYTNGWQHDRLPRRRKGYSKGSTTGTAAQKWTSRAKLADSCQHAKKLATISTASIKILVVQNQKSSRITKYSTN